MITLVLDFFFTCRSLAFFLFFAWYGPEFFVSQDLAYTNKHKSLNVYS